MPIWRCPHCATPQAETARCWVCRRSTTSCGTCLHFRRGVASGLGFCGLDRQRLPLRGDEMRACWVARGEVPGSEPPDERARRGPAVAAFAADADGRRHRTFVPVDELERPATGSVRGPSSPPPAAVPPSVASAPVEPPRWSLWGDAEG